MHSFQYNYLGLGLGIFWGEWGGFCMFLFCFEIKKSFNFHSI